MPKPKRVFISHSTQDRDFVEREVISLLRSHGVETWYSKDDIETASQWKQVIVEGLKSCDWFLVALSPHSVASRWVEAEVDWAFAHRPDRFVPVIIEECDWDEFNLLLRNLQNVDLSVDRQNAQIRLLKTWDIEFSTRPETQHSVTRNSELNSATEPVAAATNTHDQVRDSVDIIEATSNNKPWPLLRAVLQLLIVSSILASVLIIISVAAKVKNAHKEAVTSLAEQQQPQHLSTHSQPSEIDQKTTVTKGGRMSHFTVFHGGSEIVDGSTTPIDFGTFLLGSTGPTQTFTVRNDGDAPLEFGQSSSPIIDVPPDFKLIEDVSPTIAPGNEDTFTVQVDAAIAGAKSGQISFVVKDAEHNPFKFSITCGFAATGEILLIDDFSRPDGAAGNGWLPSVASSPLQILNDRLVNPNAAKSGIYQFLPFEEPLRIQANITTWGVDSFEHFFLLGYTPTIGLSGYGIHIAHTSSSYADSAVNLVHDSRFVGSVISPFQFHKSLDVDFVVKPMVRWPEASPKDPTSSNLHLIPVHSNSQVITSAT